MVESCIDRAVDVVTSAVLVWWHKWRAGVNRRHKGLADRMLEKNREIYEKVGPGHPEEVRINSLREHFGEREAYHTKRLKEESYGKK